MYKKKELNTSVKGTNNISASFLIHRMNVVSVDVKCDVEMQNYLYFALTKIKRIRKYTFYDP